MDLADLEVEGLEKRDLIAAAAVAEVEFRREEEGLFVVVKEE